MEPHYFKKLKKLNFNKVIKFIYKKKLWISLLILLVIMYKLYFLKEYFSNDELTEEELSEKIKGDKSLVLFYASWCGHCKKLKPVWDKLAQNNENMIKINVGDNTPQQKVLIEKYNVKGFPTMIKFENGKNMGVFEGRTEEEILQYFN